MKEQPMKCTVRLDGYENQTVEADEFYIEPDTKAYVFIKGGQTVASAPSSRVIWIDTDPD